MDIQCIIIESANDKRRVEDYLKVYLSGKITGDSNYKEKFASMTEELLSYGYTVFNPAVLPDGFEYEDYMSLDLKILSKCDAIFLLRDWKNSPGAKREYEEALKLGLKILSEDDLKIRRTLNQLCVDTIKISEIEIENGIETEWAVQMKELSEKIQKRVGEFDLTKTEIENFNSLCDELNSDERNYFINEFIKDGDKQLEYDLLENIQTNDDEAKRRFSQMFVVAGDLVEMTAGMKVYEAV